MSIILGTCHIPWNLWICYVTCQRRFEAEDRIKVVNQFSSVQLLSRVRLFVTPWTAACQTSLFITTFTQTHVHWVGDATQPSHPLSSPSTPSLNPSQDQGLFQWVTSSHEVANWSFSFSIISSKEHPGLISFRMDWLDLLAVQGTLKSLLQHHSSKALILGHSTFFMVQLSHAHMTTGRTIHNFGYMDLCDASAF